MYTPQNWMKNKHIQQCWGMLGSIGTSHEKKAQRTTLYHVIICHNIISRWNISILSPSSLVLYQFYPQFYPQFSHWIDLREHLQESIGTPSIPWGSPHGFPVSIFPSESPLRGVFSLCPRLRPVRHRGQTGRGCHRLGSGRRGEL